MSRHVAKHRPKQIRRLEKRLLGAGYANVVETTHRGYRLTWWSAKGPMHLNLGPAPAGDSINALWGKVRSQFRARGLAVPA